MQKAELPVKRDCMNEIFPFLGCNAALIGRQLPTFRDNLSLSFAAVIQEEVLENVTDRLSRNVGNYRSTPSKIPGDRSSLYIAAEA
jgi:hypothetical protein